MGKPSINFIGTTNFAIVPNVNIVPSFIEAVDEFALDCRAHSAALSITRLRTTALPARHLDPKMAGWFC